MYDFQIFQGFGYLTVKVLGIFRIFEEAFLYFYRFNRQLGIQLIKCDATR